MRALPKKPAAPRTGVRGVGIREPLANATVLLVDDDPGVCSFVRRALKSEGYEVFCAHTAAEAEELLGDEDLSMDLVLLDVGLPDRTGWDVLQQLRAGGDATPVVFLSAQHEVPDRVRGLELGADDYLQKPFRPEELSARIAAVLRRHDRLQLKRTAL